MTTTKRKLLLSLAHPDDESFGSGGTPAYYAALHCHRTQFGPNNPFELLPKETVSRMMSREHFVRVWPEPEPDFHLSDLFAGL